MSAPAPRPSHRSAWAWSGVFAAVISVAVTLAFLGSAYQPGQGYQLSDRLVELELVEQDGRVYVDLDRGEGQALTNPQDFIQELHQRKAQNDGPWRVVRRALDITSTTGLLWIAFGLAAQALFAGRMIVQWIASEKAKRSTVPVAFWWMSLIGSSMLLCYFGWRKEWVGVLGQCTGWFVYVRNLWMIHSPHPPQAAAEATPQAPPATPPESPPESPPATAPAEPAQAANDP
ncbi:MAG: lipid-A-disaccharide synthase N-terminal domain-containing protein [Planctomycetota bacterium]